MREVEDWPVSLLEDWLAWFHNRAMESEARSLGKDKWEMTLRVMHEAEDREARGE